MTMTQRKSNSALLLIGRDTDPNGPSLEDIRRIAQDEANKYGNPLAIGWVINDNNAMKELGYCPLAFVGDPAFVLEKLEEVAPSDEALESLLGQRLADELQIKKSKLHPGKYTTRGGTKTDFGLARTMRRIIADHDKEHVVAREPVDISHLTTVVANLKRAILNRETVRIGGGDFNHKELQSVLSALENVQQMLGFIQSVADDEECCTCHTVSWRGEEHMSACVQQIAIDLVEQVQP